MALPWHVRITDDTICLAHTDPPRLFDYYPDTATATADQARANANTLAPEGGYAVMTYAEYETGMRSYYLGQTLREITEEQYYYALEVLPPEAWHTGDGVNRFLMSEYQHATYTQQYAVWQGRYFCRMVDARDRTTWITAAQCAAVLEAPVPAWSGHLMATT